MSKEIDSKLRILVDFAKSADLEEIVWEKDGVKVAFKKRFGAQPEEVKADSTVQEKEGKHIRKNHIITSPMVGTFKLSTGKGRPPLVVEGGHISPGQKVGIVEAMNIPKDVVSDTGGSIIKILVGNEKPVEYGQPLFEVKQADV